jgi:hypothetical protein
MFSLCSSDDMPKRPSWYDPETETSPLLTAMAELRLECCRAAHVMPHAIKEAIDRWAECEMGARDFFYGRGHSIGPTRKDS